MAGDSYDYPFEQYKDRLGNEDEFQIPGPDNGGMGDRGQSLLDQRFAREDAQRPDAQQSDWASGQSWVDANEATGDLTAIPMDGGERFSRPGGNQEERERRLLGTLPYTDADGNPLPKPDTSDIGDDSTPAAPEAPGPAAPQEPAAPSPPEPSSRIPNLEDRARNIWQAGGLGNAGIAGPAKPRLPEIRRPDGSLIEGSNQVSQRQTAADGVSKVVPPAAVLREFFNRANQSIPQVPGGPRNPAYGRRNQAVLDLYRHMVEKHMEEKKTGEEKRLVSMEAQRREGDKAIETQRQEKAKAEEARTKEAAREKLKAQGGSRGKFYELHGEEAPDKLDKMYVEEKKRLSAEKKDYINQFKPGKDATPEERKKYESAKQEAEAMFSEEANDKKAKDRVQQRLDHMHPPDKTYAPGEEAYDPGQAKPKGEPAPVAKPAASPQKAKEQEAKFGELMKAVGVSPQQKPAKPITPEIGNSPSSIPKDRTSTLASRMADHWNSLGYWDRWNNPHLSRMANIPIRAHNAGRTMTISERGQYERYHAEITDPELKKKFQLQDE